MNPYDDGLCREVDGDLFFPEARDYATTRSAKLICHRCPAQAECLEMAMATEFGGKNARDGIYGGTTASERAAMWKRRPKPINHGTEGGFKAHQRRGEQACKLCRDAAVLARALRKERAA